MKKIKEALARQDSGDCISGSNKDEKNLLNLTALKPKNGQASLSKFSRAYSIDSIDSIVDDTSHVKE
jgi:hypothetical protein